MRRKQEELQPVCKYGMTLIAGGVAKVLKFRPRPAGVIGGIASFPDLQKGGQRY
jgi:hypothetical protein